MSEARSVLLPYNLDERLLTELAQGTEDPISVIERYDYTEDEAAALAANPYVVKQVEALRADLEKTGYMDALRDKQNGRLLTDHMMVRALQGQVKDENILKLIELLHRRDDRRQQAEREANNLAGGGFSISITVQGGPQTNVAFGAAVPANLPMYLQRLESDIIDVTPTADTMDSE